MPDIATFVLKKEDAVAEEIMGKMILTDYGKKRMLERVANFDDPIKGFIPINVSHIVIGSKMNKKYNSKNAVVGNPIATYQVTPEMVTVNSDSTCIIKTDLKLEGEIVMQEIGLYETYKKQKKLLAYASGFSMIKEKDISYSLIVDLEIQLSFENQHYTQYGISLGDREYAKLPALDTLYKTLTDVQLDLERSIESNAKKLGYNRPEVFYQDQIKMMQMLQNSLMFSRYQKIVQTLKSENMTDCFYYPETSEESYFVRNLQDASSRMEVTGKLQKCNRDNITFAGPASIILTANIGSLDRTGMVIGKVEPSQDAYYVDFRISSDDVDDKSSTRYLQFTIYSYDKNLEYPVQKGQANEFDLVGHYRIKYEPTEEIKAEILGKETMYTFIYNGDKQNPNIDFYINTHKITPIVDNFNFSAPEEIIENPTFEYLRNPDYTGACEHFRSKTTLRNYVQTSGTANYEDKPTYYVLPDIKITSFFAFNTTITEKDIVYLALINQS